MGSKKLWSGIILQGEILHTHVKNSYSNVKADTARPLYLGDTAHELYSYSRNTYVRRVQATAPRR